VGGGVRCLQHQLAADGADGGVVEVGDDRAQRGGLETLPRICEEHDVA
jgi:hypothetical protein